MIKLIDILKEIVINEYNKSQIDYISNKLNIPNDDMLKNLMNSLNSQNVKYLDIKSKILDGNIKNLKDLKNLKTVSKQDNLRQIKKNEIEKIFEKNNISIYVPYTYEASCIYGAGTKWCTASKNEDLIDYFYNHTLDIGDTLYYIIDKNLTNEFKKVAIVVNYEGKITDIFDSTNKFDYDRNSFAKNTTTYQEKTQNYLNYLESKGVNLNIFKTRTNKIKKFNREFNPHLYQSYYPD
jgi:hypothetical protein